MHLKYVFLKNNFWLQWKDLYVLLPYFIKEVYEVTLQTTIEVDRAYSSTESAQKEGNKGKVFVVQGVSNRLSSGLLSPT